MLAVSGETCVAEITVVRGVAPFFLQKWERLEGADFLAALWDNPTVNSLALPGHAFVAEVVASGGMAPTAFEIFPLRVHVLLVTGGVSVAEMFLVKVVVAVVTGFLKVVIVLERKVREFLSLVPGFAISICNLLSAYLVALGV